MGKWEKCFCIFYLLYMLVYIPVFIGLGVTGEMSFDLIFPFHMLGMALGLIFLIVVIRDIYKRDFPNPNSKVTWTILILMFWPSIFVYLPKYGFKPRPKQTTVNSPIASGPRAGKLIVTVLILVGVAFAALVAYRILPGFWLGTQLQEEGRKRLAELETFSPEEVERVDVYDRYGAKLLVTTSDAADLSAFVEAAKKMDDWVPNHPSFERQLHVVLRRKDGQKYEFEMCFMQPGDSIVYVYGVRKEGNTTYYLYRKKSRALAEWLRNQGVGI